MNDMNGSRLGLWLGSLTAAALVTLAMLAFRERLDTAHIALAYLMVVLGSSAWGGRNPGLALAVLTFLCFNFFFLPPYYTFVVADPLDWLVLGTYLATATVASQLLFRARSQAEAARRRTEELDRLSTLGAETLNVGRAEEALASIAEMIRSTLGVDICEIVWTTEKESAPLKSASIIARSKSDGQPVRDRAVQPFIVPLRVRHRTVGVLRIADSHPITLEPEQQRFIDTLSFYAALGVERVRLMAKAEQAEALGEADRLKNALIASVSHDLRTPLTTIKALAHELAASGDERALIIEEEADRLNRFVADLLDLSRLNSGALRVSPEINAAEDLLGAAAQQVSGALGSRELRIALDTRDLVLLGKFDFVHSLRVLTNLIENAHKYSPPDARVEVSARRNRDRLLFIVADRGAGVPPGEQDRIFEAFYRPPGVAPDTAGTGLGLAIAHRLAQAQQGGVSYEPRDGGGSKFVFWVPAAQLTDLEEESS